VLKTNDISVWGGVLVAAFALLSLGAADAGPGAPRGDAGAGGPRAEAPGAALPDRTTAVDYQRAFRDQGLTAWRKRVPKTEVIRIRSSADGRMQRAIWYDSGSSQPKPLLVVLHSWGADYKQNLDIPFAEFAIENDWAFVHPDFRGPNLRPAATGSDLAVQDVVDAVEFARRRAAIDGARIYLVGYSGGGMAALVLAAKRPDLWAGVAAWGAIYDIADWYHHPGKERHYGPQIAASCGGPPRPGTAAEAECRERSPAMHLENAAGRVPVLIAHGLGDKTVPPRYAMSAFDALAEPGDRFTDEQRAFVDERGQVPEELKKNALKEDATSSRSLFESAGTPVRLERRSKSATIVLFEGGHDMVYNPTLKWLGAQRRP
jgi:predicted esterase